MPYSDGSEQFLQRRYQRHMRISLQFLAGSHAMQHSGKIHSGGTGCLRIHHTVA